MRDVTVVGSGPNGLAAAITMAREGLDVTVLEGAESVGGGLRTSQLTVPGFHHDVCSAVHPAAVASPYFRHIGLVENIDWITPALSYAHPLDDGSAGLAWRDLDRTVQSLGRDGPAWRRVMEPLLERIDGVVEFTSRQLLRIPRDPVAALHFGLRSLLFGMGGAPLLFSGDEAPALITGCAAHLAGRTPSVAQAGAGLLLAAHAHAGGWSYPRGGSRAIADALVVELERHGGRVETGQWVRTLDEVPRSRVTILDTSTEILRTSPSAPASYRRALGKYRYGSGVAKVDLALSGPVPWRIAELTEAPTLHLGGDAAAIAVAENDVARGRMAARPFVLVTQPSVLDDTRAPAGGHTLWAYIHVPNNSDVDPRPPVLAELERHAPGVRDLVIGSSVRRASEMAGHNPNHVGGDIYTGELTLRQLLRRPVLSPTPWRTPLPGVYLCSSATPPGPAVHGMNGWFAAQVALRDVFDVRVELPRRPTTT